MPDDHEVRELRYRLKQANQRANQQGETIHLLRCELAEARELNSKIDRGDLRRMERQNAELKADLAHATAEVQKLRAEREPEPSR